MVYYTYSAHIRHSVTLGASASSCQVCVTKFELRDLLLLQHQIVYKVLWRNMLSIKPGTPGLSPPSLNESALGYFPAHGTNGFTSHPKDKTSWLSVLLKGHKRHERDSNSHSADKKKHHSLSPVLLTKKYTNPWKHIVYARTNQKTKRKIKIT